MRTTRKILLAAAVAPLFACGLASAQTMNGVSGAYARNSDLDPHDTASEPSMRDKLINGIREDSVNRSAAAARANAAYAIPAGPHDIVAGAGVNDYRGKPLGTVEAVQADGAVISNGTGHVLIQFDAFGRNRKGLMLDVSKDEFDRMVAKANEAAPKH